MINIVILLASVALTTSNDIFIGTNNLGRKVFDENRHATPAIWTRAENVTVNATTNEVISRIIVTDLRSEKDGQVKIVDGGEGQKTVTLELQSPAAFRGFDFHIEVYTAPDGQINDNHHNEEPLHPGQTIQDAPEESAVQNPEGDKAPLLPIHEIRQIVVPTTSPIFYMTTENKENENVNSDTEINDNTPLVTDQTRETTDKLEHDIEGKTEKDSPSFDGFSRPVRNSDNISGGNNTETSRDLKGIENIPNPNPIVVARQSVFEANAQTDSDNDKKIVAQDTSTEKVDNYSLKTSFSRFNEFEGNTDSPHIAGEQIATKEGNIKTSFQPRRISTRDTKKEENTPVQGTKHDANRQTNSKDPDISVRLFDPIIERRKRQALNVEEDKIGVNPAPFADEDVSVTINDDENITSFPRTQETAEQSSGSENLGIPIVYYERNTDSPQLAAEKISIKEDDINTGSQPRHIFTRDIKKEEVTFIKPTKHDANHQTNPQDADLSVKIFDPIIERRKRQALNVEEDKIGVNAPSFVADEDVKVTNNDDENVTLFPRTQDTNKQTSGSENEGIPIIYYPLPYSTQRESSTTDHSLNNQDFEPGSDSKDQDDVDSQNDNITPSDTPVISK